MMRVGVARVMRCRCVSTMGVPDVTMADVTDVTVAAAMTMRTVAGVTMTSQTTHCHRAEANGAECETDYIRIHKIRPVPPQATSRRPASA